jgi:hypothetical protein
MEKSTKTMLLFGVSIITGGSLFANIITAKGIKDLAKVNQASKNKLDC